MAAQCPAGAIGYFAPVLPLADRFFPAEADVRATARSLYQGVAEAPIVSPHGHVDAGMILRDEPYPDPVALLVRPDHYVLRLMHAHGATLPELGVAPRSGPVAGEVAGPRDVWRRLCHLWPAFRGTVMRLWLEHELADLFGLDEPLSDANADATYDLITARLAGPDMKPRALYHRFRLEVLATTDSPLDDLAAHRALRADQSWDGRVVPTFRPDSLTDPAAGPGWSDRVSQLAQVAGVATDTYSGFIAALEARRAEFKSLGATATDHGHPDAEAQDLSEWEAARLFDRIRLGRHDAGDERLFSGHMLMEMARMSAEDGLVMQLHPGIWRSHDVTALARFGPDLGADFPVATGFTASLARLLSRFGSAPGFRMVAFTVDETVYPRELAPMASYYPGLWLGAPWWFLDAPDAMMRFWSAVTESAGFAKSAGFVDDTRAYCSIPARHDVARRAHCSFLARLVHEHRVSPADAAELAADFAYHLPKKAFRL
ncbi:MAG TPA: glucuronate isomerase [Acidimicrobiales bacterium]|nr:glucuronate isomerase [Acidimicrobiales bacterium]